MKLSQAQQLLEQLRATAAANSAQTAADNTKKPLSAAEQKELRAHIAENSAPWLLAFYDLSLATGWRTADVCALTFGAIDFVAGTASIIVSKQTKQAQSRALTKSLEQVRKARKLAALAVNDSAAYMRWDAADKDTLAAEMTAAERQQAAIAVASAKAKTDCKALPSQLLKALEQMKAERAAVDSDYIFASSLSTSRNKSQGNGGHLSRVTAWKHMKSAIESVADKLQTVVKKLSAYSLRKSFAVNLLEISKSLDVVMAAFGHSSSSITRRYLSLDDDAARYQREMISK